MQLSDRECDADEEYPRDKEVGRRYRALPVMEEQRNTGEAGEQGNSADMLGATGPIPGLKRPDHARAKPIGAAEDVETGKKLIAGKRSPEDLNPPPTRCHQLSRIRRGQHRHEPRIMSNSHALLPLTTPQGDKATAGRNQTRCCL